MIIWFGQLKTPQRRIQITSQKMPQKVCQYPPTIIMKQTEGKDNLVTILMMKVCVLLFHCYGILMLLFFC